MTHIKPTTDLGATDSHPIAKALNKNDSVKLAVKQSADELVVISAVLKHGIPKDAIKGDVAQALEKTEQIEGTIQTSVQDLATVNKLLEHEIVERLELERELQATKAALASKTQKH